MSSDEKHKGLLIMFTIGFLCMLLSTGDSLIRWLTLGVFIVIGQVIDWLVYYPKYKKYLVNQHEKELLEAKRKDRYMKLNNIPREAECVRCIDGGYLHDVSNKGVYIWSDKNYLYLIGTNYKKNNKKYSISIKNIKYYTIEGYIHNKIDVNGNISGGGSSIKGAIAGGVLAGSTGAIIGSRKPSNINIKSNNTIIDERETVLVIKYDYRVSRIIFNAYAYKIFTKLVPEKDKEYVLFERQQ